MDEAIATTNNNNFTFPSMAILLHTHAEWNVINLVK